MEIKEIECYGKIYRYWHTNTKDGMFPRTVIEVDCESQSIIMLDGRIDENVLRTFLPLYHYGLLFGKMKVEDE